MPDLSTCSRSALPEGKASAVSAGRRIGDLRLADWLSLAAAPTFITMTVATALVGDTSMMTMCSGGQGTFPLTGMATMYLLMSAFHLSPWLRLASPTKAPR